MNPNIYGSFLVLMCYFTLLLISNPARNQNFFSLEKRYFSSFSFRCLLDIEQILRERMLYPKRISPTHLVYWNVC